MNEALGALEKIRQYVEVRNPRLLYEGWNQLISGGQQMQIAQTRYSQLLEEARMGLVEQLAQGEAHLEKISREQIQIWGEEEE